MFRVYRVVKFREEIIIRVVSWFLRGGRYVVVVSNYQNGSIGSHQNEEKNLRVKWLTFTLLISPFFILPLPVSTSTLLPPALKCVDT